MLIDCDFHIHSKYSGATSKNMDLENISKQGKLKGLNLIGTGDALHKLWLEELKTLKEFSDGIYKKNDVFFIVTTEVEDIRRVHHLILLPGISSAESLRESLQRYSKDLDSDGRPKVGLSGEEIAEIVSEVQGLLGPAHAFVPWTSIYKEYDSLAQCYGDSLRKIKFLELGLSADSELADYIAEVKDLTFLSNSDAHSPWPHRLGREFNRLKVTEVTFKEIEKAIERRAGNKVVLNVGLDPRLGKYHATSCIKCYKHYTLEEAIKSNWRCGCGGIIKKGVKDRIKELASYSKPKHPEHRPPYLRIAPLAEILCMSLNVSNVYSQKVQAMWKKLVERFGSEIAVLVDIPIPEIKKEFGDEIAFYIDAFRKENFDIKEGGGGKYGRIIFRKEQYSLDDF
ncbi:MAG: TIGR00375 family protein [Candidatus Hydrothermarchaeota archaeon]|nr:MAG: TIGR00375 family protein [Candidatus Hydrothermarchaeota archaeon]